MKYMLDTNTVIYFLKGRYPSIAEHLRHIPSRNIVISAVTVAELQYGARKSRDYEKTSAVTGAFINTFSHIAFDDRAAEYYGIIRSELFNSGKPIGANDMLIAAGALAEDAVLVTHNTKEFSRVKGLKYEDWVSEEPLPDVGNPDG